MPVLSADEMRERFGPPPGLPRYIVKMFFWLFYMGGLYAGLLGSWGLAIALGCVAVACWNGRRWV
jgi:hypothetical protein